MRFHISLIVAVLIAIAGLTACNSTEQTSKAPAAPPGQQQQPAPLPPGPEARRVTPAEVKDEVARNNVLIIDVRGEAAYKQGHIKGAIQIPATEILAHVDELPRNKLIATYCA
jgi:3-mercaptopyruvate sulfurtransferase SseA